MQIFTKIQQLGLGFDAHFSWIDADFAHNTTNEKCLNYLQS